MQTNKRFVGVIVIIILVLGLAGFGAYKMFYKDFQQKIVYTTDTNTDQTPLRNDCIEKGGVFNECGSPCDSKSDGCIVVCAYTCEFDKKDELEVTNSDNLQNDSPESNQVATSTAIDTSNWKTYKNDKYGFEFMYPQDNRLDEGEHMGEFGVYIGKDKDKGALEWQNQLLHIEVDSTPTTGTGFIVGDHPEKIASGPTEIDIGGEKCKLYRIRWTSPEGKTYVTNYAEIIHGGVAFRFADPSVYVENQSIFFDLISTFKFTK